MKSTYSVRPVYRVLCSACVIALFGAPTLLHGQGMKARSPEKIAVPFLDPVVVESRDKVEYKNWVLRQGGSTSAKSRASDRFDSAVAQGDVYAAIQKAGEARKSGGKVSLLPDAGRLETLLDQGIAAGTAEAFRAKAEIEWEQGKTDAALAHLREASLRGSAAADFTLARCKAEKPDWTAVADPPAVLLERAALRGDPNAALTYGLALDQGLWRIDPTHAIRCAHSPEQALEWMERAALLGIDEARLWLGLRYMKVAEGLVDLRRQKALENLLSVRKADPELKEPASGKTFAELEASGVFEPGLLGEIKRREAQERTHVANNRAAVSSKAHPSGPAPSVRAANVRQIDHQFMAIAGDRDAAGPVYNLIGLSPYKEIAGEGSVAAAAGNEIRTGEKPAAIAEVAGWRVDLIAGGEVFRSLAIQAVDATAKIITVVDPLPEPLRPRVRYRLVRYHTLFSTFGRDNRVGLKPGTGASSADEVILFDSRVGSYRHVFFDAGRRRWADGNSGEPLANDIEISPGRGLFVKHSESGTLTLQARGMLPQQSFDFQPVQGVSVVSTRRSQVGASAGSGAGLAGLVMAGDLPVLAKRGANWAVEPNASDWWTTFGLRASDRIYVVSGSAAVVVNE